MEKEFKAAHEQQVEERDTRIGFFIKEVYNEKRIHSALNYLTTAEFGLAWRHTFSQRVLETPPMV